MKMQETLKRLRERHEELGSEGGFTLIELLIVIVILAILAAIVVFAVSNLTGTSAKSACKSDFRTVEGAVEAFKAQTGAYPGGTYNTGYTINQATAPASYTTPTASATDLKDGVRNLLASTDTDSNAKTIGPWLKDWPVNAGHYEIVVSDPTGTGTNFGQIDVYKSDGSALVNGASTNHTAADCEAVS